MSTRAVAVLKRNLSRNEIENSFFEPQAQICKAMANAVRLRILDRVSQGECSAADLQESLGISKANLSQHTSLLQTVGLIAKRREGNHAYFSLALPEAKQACQVLREFLHARIAETRRLWNRTCASD